MRQPLISLIVPIYKVEPYLRQCVDSLIGQDYGLLEIILVDDGSPDRSGEICDDYAQRDKRIKVVHKQNGGLSSARNAGLDIATGDYVMCVDSDDWVDEDYCSKALESASQHDADIVVFGYRDVYPDHTVIQTVSLDQEQSFTPEEALMELHGGKILSFAWNKIYRASLFQGVRYPEGRLYEDIGTTYRLFARARSIYLSSACTYNYRKRDDSILGCRFGTREAVDWFDMDMERFAFLRKHYPALAEKLWAFYGRDTMRFLKTVAADRAAQQKAKEMEHFMTANRAKLKQSGFRDSQWRLLCACPSLFYALRRAIKIVKKR